MDWNWFFSALAQSTAAIVGLIGAFVFTKIVNDQSEFTRLLQGIARLQTRSDYLRNRASNRYIRWYNEGVRDRIAERIEDLLRSENPPEKFEDVLPSLVPSPYDDQDEVTRFSEAKFEEAHQEIEDEERRRAKRERGTGGVGGILDTPGLVFNNSVVTQLRGMREYQIDDQIQEEREKIDSLVVEIRHHIAEVRRLLGAAHSGSLRSPVVRNSTILLVVLFLLGVVYPLSFMPVQEGAVIGFDDLSLMEFVEIMTTLKGWLLAFIGVGVIGLAGAFLRIDRSLVIDPAQISSLESRTELKWYSEYFANLKDQEGQERSFA